MAEVEASNDAANQQLEGARHQIEELQVLLQNLGRHPIVCASPRLAVLLILRDFAHFAHFVISLIFVHFATIVFSADIELSQIDVGALTQFHVSRLSEQEREEWEENSKYSFLGQHLRADANANLAPHSHALPLHTMTGNNRGRPMYQKKAKPDDAQLPQGSDAQSQSAAAQDRGPAAAGARAAQSAAAAAVSSSQHKTRAPRAALLSTKCNIFFLRVFFL